MSRTPRLLALALLVAGSAGAVVIEGSPVTAGAPASDWCGDRAAPCIVSVTHDGSPVAQTDPLFQVTLSEFEPGHDVQWNLMQGELYELGPEAAGEWTVVLDTGTALVPRVAYGNGRHGDVTRVPEPDGSYTVTMTAEPTLVTEGCDISTYPWPCPTTATDQADRLAAQLLDWHFWEDAVQRRAFYGVDFWTNVSTNSFPPGVIYDDATGIARMQLELAAPHFETDGSTVHHGHFEAVLPNDFLHENFFIPTPTTMTPGSLAVAGGGPVASTIITKASAADPMVIEVTDMTFTIRKLRVSTGTITPTRPTDLAARRTTDHAGRLSYDLAKARGARVTGYQARCVPAHGDTVKGSVAGNASPLKVTGLRSGTAYSCQVRATSKAGNGAWSAEDAMPRRP